MWLSSQFRFFSLQDGTRKPITIMIASISGESYREITDKADGLIKELKEKGYPPCHWCFKESTIEKEYYETFNSSDAGQIDIGYNR